MVRYPKTSCEWSFISNGLIWNFDISINLIRKFSLLCEMFDGCTQLEYADIDMMCMLMVPWFVYLMFILIDSLLLDDISIQFYMFLRLCSSNFFLQFLDAQSHCPSKDSLKREQEVCSMKRNLFMEFQSSESSGWFGIVL